MIEDINSALTTLHPRVPLFGAILFTERDANVIKALKDPEYYNALHVASGDSLAIFATMMFPGHYGLPPSRPGVIHMMMQVWQEPSANLQLLSAFGLRDSKDFPTFALFTFEGEHMHYHLHKIASDTPAKVFESLGAAITATCDGSASPSFAAARKKLKWLTVKATIRRVFAFVGAFRGISGI